jgi:hypothetical protein
MFGLLMDYHLIFIVVCIILFLISIVLIWLEGTKQAVIVAVLFLSINQLFCILSMIGFFSIGYVGYNTSTGETIIYSYEGMQMFYMIFFGLLWLNGLMLFIAIYKYMRIVIREQMRGYV